MQVTNFRTLMAVLKMKNDLQHHASSKLMNGDTQHY